MADRLLAARGGEPVGKNWPKRLVARTPSLKMMFARAKDRQRQKQEDPEVVGAWFKLVGATKAKYGVVDKDVYNFNKWLLDRSYWLYKSCYRLRKTCSAYTSARRPRVGYLHPEHSRCRIRDPTLHIYYLTQ
jgi:hypothetical protein